MIQECATVKMDSEKLLRILSRRLYFIASVLTSKRKSNELKFSVKVFYIQVIAIVYQLSSFQMLRKRFEWSKWN